MAIIDIFKKKEEEKKVQKTVKKEKTVRPSVKKVEKTGVLEKGGKRTSKYDFSGKILKAPYITEKSTDLAAKDFYVFEVWPKANKKEVEKAVESIFQVDVITVKMVNIPGKEKIVGRTKGKTPGKRKALVRVKKGQKIELMAR